MIQVVQAGLTQMSESQALMKHSRQSTPQSMSKSAENNRRASEVVQRILRRFPDYGKASPDYVIGLVEFVATFPNHVQDAFVDISKGITTRTKFTPTIFDFQVMADELIGSSGEREARAFRLADLQARVEARRYLPEVKFIQPVQYFDKQNNRITERESREREAQSLRDKESLRKTDRLTGYVRFLGGWEKAIEQGIGCVDDVPAEWISKPTTEVIA